MLSNLEFLIAMRFLSSKRKEGFISVIGVFSFFGIMIGVATLIIVMSVMNGFRFELVNRILGINSHLSINSKDHEIGGYEEIIARLKSLPTIKSVNPLLEEQVMLISDSKNAGGLVRGIELLDLENKELIANNLIDGKLQAIGQKDHVVIGSKLAQQLNLRVGDHFKIVSAKTNETIIGTIPRIKTYEVGGIFESGLFEYDSSTIFMNLAMAQLHFQKPEKISSIEIFVDDLNDLSIAKREIFRILVGFDGLYIADWQQMNSGFIDALKVETTVMFLILTLIIIVAAFNIISSMIMLVSDKNKNIALLRTIGLSKHSVMRIFLICGFSIGAIGTLIGTILGILFAANIDRIKSWLESFTDTELFNPAVYFLSTLPSKIFASDVILITVMALLLSFLATIYPAYKASKANPAEILRYE